MIITRPDLSTRTALSKSEMTAAHWCELSAYFARTSPRPYLPSADMTFGSCVDAAVEVAITALRSDQPIPIPRALAAAAEVALRDEQAIDMDAVELAVEQFGLVVAPAFDWSHALTQHTIRLPIDGLGDCEGHPDIILGDLVLDVKTAKRAKTDEDVYLSPELGFYALLRERETGEPVRQVGYLTWLRLKKPMWQTLIRPVTPDLLAEGLTEARRRVNMRRLIDTVAAKGADPVAYFSGPRYAGRCLDCRFAEGCEVGQRRVRLLTPKEEET